MQKKITIIGAGLAGCFLAILFSKRGYKVEIYERFSKNEIANTASKRSFNLTFYGYAVKALQMAGLWNEVEKDFLKLKGSVTQVTQNSKPVFVRFDYDNMTYYTIQRARLLEILINYAAKDPSIKFHFNSQLFSINRQKKIMFVQNTRSKKMQEIACDIIIGTDGVNSQVRPFIQQGQESQHKQEYEKWSYKQIVIDKKTSQKCGLLKDTQHAWTRKNASIIAFPNGDDSFTAMLLLPKNKTHGFASLASNEQIEQFVKGQVPHLLPALPLFQKELLTNPEGNLVTVSTNPWYYKDFMVLVGDSAHGCLPFYGIGTSVAFGDCMELVSLVDKYGTDWRKIFPLYQEERKRHTDVIAQLAKESFVGFRRYKKADYTAISDRIQVLLYSVFPQFFQPPIFYLVANNPNKAADYFSKLQRQQKFAKLMGIPLLIKTLTGVISIGEAASKLLPTSAAATAKATA